MASCGAGNAAANVALVRVADASPAATPQKNVDVFVLEMHKKERGGPALASRLCCLFVTPDEQVA